MTNRGCWWPGARRLARRSALAIAASLLLAGPAAALPVPRLDTDRVVAVAGGTPIVRTAQGGLERLLPGRRTARVGLVGTGTVDRVFGTPSRLAITRFPSNYGGPAALLAGPPGGPLTLVTSCVASNSQVVLGDTAVAFVAGGCGASGDTLELSDLRGATPAAPSAVASVSRTGNLVALTGTLVAFTDPAGQIEVRDWSAGTLVRSVPLEAPATDCRGGYLPDLLSPTPRLCGFGVNADGSVWQLIDSPYISCDSDCLAGNRYNMPVYVDPCDGRLDVSNPGTSAPITAARQVCADLLRVAGGSALYRTQTGSAPGATRELRVAAAGNASPLRIGNAGVLDFTGSTLTYVTTSCTGQRVEQASLPLASPIPVPQSGSDCVQGMQASGAVLHLGARPTVTLALRCRFGCVGPLVVGGARESDRPEGASRDFILAAGHAVRLSIRLPRHGALARRARGRRHLTLGLWVLGLNDDPRHPLRRAGVAQLDLTARVRAPR